MANNKMSASEYRRNLSNSLKAMNSKFVATHMPALSSVSQNVSSVVNQYRVNNIRNKNRLSIGFKSTVNSMKSYVGTTFANIKDGLKTGKFYASESDTAIGSMMQDFGDENTETNQSATDFAGGLGSGINQAFKDTGNIIAGGADYLGNLITAGNNAAAISGLQNHMESMSVMGNIQSLAKAQLDFSLNEMNGYIQSSLQYYNESLDILRSIKEDLGKITARYGSPNQRKGHVLEEIFDGEHLNLKAYFNQIKKNASGEFSGLKMIFEAGGGMLQEFKDNPLGTILSVSMQNLLMSDAAKKSIKGFDDQIKKSFTKLLLEADKGKDKSGIAGVLSRILGVDLRSGQSIRTDTYRNRELTLEVENMKNKAITEVIPQYLSAIYRHFSKRDMVYDYRSGRFTTRKAKLDELDRRQKDFENSIKGKDELTQITERRNFNEGLQEELYDSGLISLRNDFYKNPARKKKQSAGANSRNSGFDQGAASEFMNDMSGSIRSRMTGWLAKKSGVYNEVLGEGGLFSQGLGWLSGKLGSGTSYLVDSVLGGKLDEKIQGLATGGISRGGLYRVGEQGEELTYLAPGSMVIPHDQSMRILRGRNGGIGGLAKGTETTGQTNSKGLGIKGGLAKGGALAKGAVISSMLGLGPLPGAIVASLLYKKNAKLSKDDKDAIDNAEAADSDKKESLFSKIGAKIKGAFSGRKGGMIKGALVSSMLGLGPIPGMVVGGLFGKKKAKLSKDDKEAIDNADAAESGKKESLFSKIGSKIKGFLKGRKGNMAKGAIISSMLGLGPLPGIIAGGLFMKKKGVKEELVQPDANAQSGGDATSETLTDKVQGTAKKAAKKGKSMAAAAKRRATATAKSAKKLLKSAMKGDGDSVAETASQALTSTDTAEEVADLKNTTDIAANVANMTGGNSKGSAGEAQLEAAANGTSTGILGALGSLLGIGGGLTIVGKAKALLTKIKSGAANFADALSIGGVVKGVSNIKSGISTLVNKDSDTVDKNNAVADVTSGAAYTAAGGLKIAGKVAKVATGGTASGFIGKLAGWIKKLITGIGGKVGSKVGAQGAKAVTASAGKVASGVTQKAGKTLLAKSATFLAKYGQMIGWAITIAQAVWDFGSGMADVNNIMGTSYGTGDPPLKLKIVCGLSKALSGFLLGLIPVKWLASIIFSLIGSEAEKAEMAEAQENQKNQYQQFIKDHPEAEANGLTEEKYNDIVNKRTSTKIWEWVKGVFGGKKASLDDYTSSTSAVTEASGGRGLYIPYYSQNDHRWKYKAFGTYNGKSDTVGKGGCGPTTAAMLLSALTGRSITPDIAADYAMKNRLKTDDGGVTSDFFKAYGNANNVALSSGKFDNSISSALKNGNPVALMGKGGIFGNNNHWVLARSINGSKIDIYDPMNPNNNGSYDLNSVKGNTIDTVKSASARGEVKIPLNTARGAIVDKKTEESIRAINAARGVVSTQTGSVTETDISSAILNVLTVISENIAKIGNSVIGASERMTPTANNNSNQVSYSSSKDSKVKNSYYSSAIKA